MILGQEEKPPLDQLAHNGVKGMKWGVRHDRDSVGNPRSGTPDVPKNHDALTKSYLALKDRALTKQEATKKLSESRAKSAAKLEPSVAGGSSKRLTPEQKALLKKIAIGTAVAGGVAAAIYFGGKSGNPALEPSATKALAFEKIEALKNSAGKSITPRDFRQNVNTSVNHSWTSSYIQPSSFERPAFTLPAGHKFHRLSTAAEETFNRTTYAVHSTEDFNRYVTHFRGEKAADAIMHHVTWENTKPLHVPSLTTTLETLRETLGKDATMESAKTQYEALSGGGWKGEGATSLMKALGKKGYGAMIDEMDAGVIGDSPLVLFASSHMGAKKAVPLTSEAIQAAESALTELTNRKGMAEKIASMSKGLSHEDKPPLDQLAHFGVKGMKWGVRKSEDPAAKAARKVENKRFNGEMGKVLQKRFENGVAGMGPMVPLSQEEYGRLSTRGKTWMAGTQLHRVVGKKNQDWEDRYVSTNEQDMYNYRVGLGARFLGISKIERHEITLKAVNKLSSPSEKERVDAFIDLMDKPAIDAGNGKMITGRDVLKRAGYGKDVKNLDATRLGLAHYREFLANQYLDTPMNSAYFNEISRRGYNAVVDDNDRGILAKDPVILLNPSGDVKRMSIRPLSKQDVKDAQKYFKAPD